MHCPDGGCSPVRAHFCRLLGHVPPLGTIQPNCRQLQGSRQQSQSHMTIRHTERAEPNRPPPAVETSEDEFEAGLSGSPPIASTRAEIRISADGGVTAFPYKTRRRSGLRGDGRGSSGASDDHARIEHTNTAVNESWVKSSGLVFDVDA
jgi:hypothetical protein